MTSIGAYYDHDCIRHQITMYNKIDLSPIASVGHTRRNDHGFWGLAKRQVRFYYYCCILVVYYCILVVFIFYLRIVINVFRFNAFNGPSLTPNGSSTKQTLKSEHSQTASRFKDISPKVASAGLAIYSGLHQIILHSPSTPSTRGQRDGRDHVEPLARDGVTSSEMT